MKKSKQNNKGPVLFIAILIAVVIIALLIKFFYVPTKTYHSDFLKITIDYPASYQLEEKFGTITLENDKTNKHIIVTSTGTNYSSLEEYIKAADGGSQNVRIVDRQNVIINGVKGIMSITQYKNNPSLNHKGYSFYKDYGIYSLYTTSSDLYSDLDRIAKSFRYEP